MFICLSKIAAIGIVKFCRYKFPRADWVFSQSSYEEFGRLVELFIRSVFQEPVGYLAQI